MSPARHAGDPKSRRPCSGTRCQPVGEQHGEQRHEDGAEEQEEALVAPDVTIKAPAVATAVTRTMSSPCGTRGTAFWSETAAEYAFANASSVPVTRSAKSATIAANPPATTAAGSAAGSPRSRESTSTTPSASSQASGTNI